MSGLGFRSGFVALVGRPNAGKSTLINTIMGSKIAITSDTAQTTRHRFRAVLTREVFQMILVDTPGIHKPHDALGEELNASAQKALEDLDVVAFLIDVSAPFGAGDQQVMDLVKGVRAKKILVLSKIDKVQAHTITTQREKATKDFVWDDIVALSSIDGEGVEDFVQLAARYLPEGPLWFPRDMQTDQSLEIMIAEFIREKILRDFREEIPHAIGVVADELAYVRKKDMYTINATIYVERESQKGMIIGKQGSAIKRIGTEARSDLEQLLGCKVFLELNVRVKKNWRRDITQIRRFGYGEGT